MAFKITGNAIGYEFRKLLNGNYNGKEWHSCKFESVKDGSTLEVSIPRKADELLDACYELTKGGIYNVPVVAVSGKERSYVIMTGTPVYVGMAE